MSEPTGPAGGDLAGTYPNPTVAHVSGANAVDTPVLTAAVSNLLLGAGRVITEYLAAGSVTLSALSAAVQAKLLAAEAVITEYLAAGAVTESKLAAALVSRLLPAAPGSIGEVEWTALFGTEREISATKPAIVHLVAFEATTEKGAVEVFLMGPERKVIGVAIKMAAGESVYVGTIYVPAGTKYKVNRAPSVAKVLAVELT